MHDPTWRPDPEMLSPLRWEGGKVVLLDQRLLPGRETWNTYDRVEDLVAAIRAMVIRGAPATSIAGALGVAMAAINAPDDPSAFRAEVERACDLLAGARPTAVNLGWAIDRLRRVADRDPGRPVAVLRRDLEREALEIWRDDVVRCRAMARHGAELVPDGSTVLTHCHTGAIATGGYGTALGAIRHAAESGKKIKVLADETRPFLQGARLTAWELGKLGIPVTVICDNTAGALMAAGEVGCVMVGADRIAHNGDVANKIGTLSLAILARHHGIPLYVVAPRSTIDPHTARGAEIPIEERPAREVTHVGETMITPEGCPVRNIAFDVTPHTLVTAVVTEVGLAAPPSGATIEALLARRD